MTFHEAVAHVRLARTPSVAAYAFIPTVRRGVTAGGAIYAVAFDAEAPEGEDPVVVEYMAGLFGSAEGEVDFYDVDDVPDEAIDLGYEPSATYDARLPEYDSEVALAVLRGATLEAALATLDAAGPPQGPNATPEALIADLLVAHGMPAILPTAAGPLPAVVVLLDDDDPWLGGLVDAFGGVVVVDAATVVDARGAGDVGRDADRERAGGDGTEEGVGEEELVEDDVAEAAWVGVGRGAVLATLLATRALPEWEGDLPADLAEAWRALLRFATLSVKAPADAGGRRPKPVYQELRREAAKVERLVARQIRDHAKLVAFVAGAVAREIADGTFVADDFILPSRAELDAPVPLFGSGLAAGGVDAGGPPSTGSV